MKFQDILVILVFVIIVVPLVIPFLKKIISRESCCGTQLGKTDNKKLKKIAKLLDEAGFSAASD